MKKRLILSLFSIIFIFPNLISAEETSINEPDETTASSPLIQIESGAAIVMDGLTGTTLFEKNADDTYYPASLTKIATAIYVIESANLEDIVTVSKKARHADGTRVYLEEGEEVSLLKLIQGLLINSGNDAGIAIAEHVSGSEKAFGKELTRFLEQQVHTTSTNFTNATGLFEEEHQTTARDLALITQYAMKNETFMEIFGTIYLPWVGQSWDTTIITHHKMLKGEYYYEGATGGKTGYVPQSGFTLATTAARNDLHLIAIVLDGTNKSIYRDTRKLFNYGFEHYEYIQIDAGSTFNYLDLNYTNEHDIIYVKEKGSTIHSKVSPTGVLHLLNEHGQVIKSVKLRNETEVPNSHTTIKKVNELSHSANENVSSNIALLITLLLFSIVVIRKLN